MSTFSVMLIDSFGTQAFDSVVRFVGADESGAFGILPGHISMVAVLRYGLARFQDAGETWHYVALPGGVLRFLENRLTVTSMQCFSGENRDGLTAQLAEAMEAEDSDIHNARLVLAQIEQSLIRRLAQLGTGGKKVWPS